MTDVFVGNDRSTQKHKPRIVQKELWVCDVCKVMKFEDFDDACRHEEVCKTGQALALRTKDAAQTPNEIKARDLEIQSKQERLSNAEQNDHANSSIPPSRIASVFQVQRKAKRDSGPLGTTDSKKKDVGVLLNVKTNSQSRKNKQKGIACFIEFQACAAFGKFPQPVSILKMGPSTNTNENRHRSQRRDISGVVIQAGHPSNQKTQVEKVAEPNKIVSTSSLAAIFQRDKKGKLVDSQAVTAEQVAAEFQAKRRLEREKENERQKKREAFFQGNPTTKGKTAICKSKKEKSIFSCPPFPVPSYVHPQAIHRCLMKSNDVLVSPEELGKARMLLQKSLPFPGRTPLHFTNDGESPWTFSDSTPSSQSMKHDMISMDSIQAELAKILTACVESPANPSRPLWIDQPLDIQQIAGGKNQSVARDVEAFLREWMLERQKSYHRIAKRHMMRMTKRKATKRRKRTKEEDEDLWIDSGDEGSSLPRVCLIEGPVGSCKSSLVHAVARQVECPVVELNTSVKRGSANLRRVLEEITLSHSSIEMLRHREANMFARNNMVDSGDETDGELLGSSLTVILIDEVDNIFESSGDSGFWPALSDLTKRAQCPVFLTANSVPKGLVSTPLRYRHFVTSRPSPMECVQTIEQVMRCNSLIIQQDALCDPVEALTSLAKLCKCDVRRIVHELQLFSCVKNSPAREAASKDSKEQPRHITLQEGEKDLQSAIVESVSPKMVPFDNYSVITITGKHFTHFREPMCVVVGGKECPGARLLDNETILAVCPPCPQRRAVEKFGMRKVPPKGMISSLEARFAPLSIQSGPFHGRLRYSSSVRSISLVDDKSVSVARPCNVEYSFSTPHDPPSDDEDVELYAGQETWKRDATSTHTCLSNAGDLQRSPTMQADLLKAADRLLNDELEKLKEQRNLGTLLPPEALCNKISTNKDCNRAEQVALDQIAWNLELASDAVALHEYYGVPFLAGASPGFGHEEGATAATWDNVTNCKSQNLSSLALHGNQDAWILQPRGRELNLVRLALSKGRGQSRSMEHESSAPDQKDDGGNANHELTDWTPFDSRVSEEDCYLRPPEPSSLKSLPSILLNAGSSSMATTHVKQDVVQGQLTHALDALGEMMSVLYSGEAQAKFHCDCLYPCTGLTIDEKVDTDSRLFLEYFPMLRNMAAYERAAHAVADHDTGDSSFRRRTRTSARQGPRHYFETLNPSYRWGDDNAWSSFALGGRLAESRLHYRR